MHRSLIIQDMEGVHILKLVESMQQLLHWTKTPNQDETNSLATCCTQHKDRSKSVGLEFIQKNFSFKSKFDKSTEHSTW